MDLKEVKQNLKYRNLLLINNSSSYIVSPFWLCPSFQTELYQCKISF